MALGKESIGKVELYGGKRAAVSTAVELALKAVNGDPYPIPISHTKKGKKKREIEMRCSGKLKFI